MASYSQSDNGESVCRDGHRFFVFDRAITADNVFHSFIVCTRCGKDGYRARNLGADVIWADGSHAESTSKE